MGIFRQFPYSNFHEMNMDQIIKILREMQDEWTATKEQWASYKDFIDNYFANLDVSQEVLEALQAMADSGALNVLIDPVIASAVTAWLAEHITPTTPAIDASLSVAGAAADAKAAGTEIRKNKHQIRTLNNFDLITGNNIRNSTTQNGVTYAWNGDICTVTGYAAPAESYNVLIAQSTGFQGDFVGIAGTKLIALCPATNASMNVRFYDSAQNTLLSLYIKGTRTIDVPENATGLMVRIVVPVNTGVNESFVCRLITLSGMNLYEILNHPVKYTLFTGTDINDAEYNSVCIVSADKTNIPIAFDGILFTYGITGTWTIQIWYALLNGRRYFRSKSPVTGTWSQWTDEVELVSQYSNAIIFKGALPANTDINTLEKNTIYVDSGNSINSPVSGSAAYIYTIGTATLSKIQYWISYINGITYYRRGMGDTWNVWQSTDPTDGNNYASMFSMGNSILTGSVWLNGVFNHLAVYGNAPYSCIAHAIGVPRSKVTHVLHSSTGLLYDAGEGSFLTNIKNTDISDYDVVLTHMWLMDMVDYQVGTLNSTANDGTLVGAVLELLNYMKTQNKQAQLILLSVPPSSTSIKGNSVFTGVYPNGSSIHDLNVIMHELADREHFTFIDYEDLNLSYFYQDYTDGDNVHFNNEDSYRIMGGYLGGRASDKINF